MRNFVCSRDCPKARHCLSIRDIPCSVYMAMRSCRIGYNDVKRIERVRDRKPTYTALKRIYESEGYDE